MIKWAQSQGAEVIATVTDARMERVLRRAGWPLERFGSPRRIGKALALAGLLDVSDEALGAVYRAGGLHQPVLMGPAPVRLAA